MKTKRTNVKKHENWLEVAEYPYHSDNSKVLDAFLELFDIKLVKYSYDLTSFYYVVQGEFYGYEEDETGREVKWREYKNDRYSESVLAMKGERLAKWIYNNFKDVIYTREVLSYKRISGVLTPIKSKIKIVENENALTGYYMDEYILKPIYQFIDRPDKNKELIDVIHDCLDSFFAACVDDMNHYYSEESFEEMYDVI